MNIAILSFAAFAVAAPETHAFGVGRNIHRAVATASPDCVSRTAPFPGHRGAPVAGPAALAAAPSDATDDAVVIDKDFRLSAVFLAAGLLLDRIPYLQLTLGPLVTALGVLFLVQTFRLDFVCDGSAFSLRDTSKEDEDAVGENIVVGGENRWTYDSFVNYDFFPEGWIDQPQGPVLVYFKETQTPSDKWDEGPGASANSDGALAKGAVKGQVHFFPALCNARQLRDVWQEKNCSRL